MATQDAQETITQTRSQIEAQKRQVQEQLSKVTQTRRTKAVIARKERSARERAKTQLKQIGSDVSEQQKKFEEAVVKSNPELAKPELKEKYYSDAKTKVTDLVNQTKSNITHYKEKIQGERERKKGDWREDVNEYKDKVEEYEAKLNSLNRSLGQDSNTLIKEYYSGYTVDKANYEEDREQSKNEQRKSQKLSEEKYQKQWEEAGKDLGFKPAFSDGKLIGFEDSKLQQSYALEYVQQLRPDLPQELERRGLIELKDVPKTKVSDLVLAYKSPFTGQAQSYAPGQQPAGYIPVGVNKQGQEVQLNLVQQLQLELKYSPKKEVKQKEVSFTYGGVSKQQFMQPTYEVGGFGIGGTATFVPPTQKELAKIQQAQYKGDVLGSALLTIPGQVFSIGLGVAGTTEKEYQGILEHGILNPKQQWKIFKDRFDYKYKIDDAVRISGKIEKLNEDYEAGKIDYDKYKTRFEIYSSQPAYKEVFEEQEKLNLYQRITKSNLSKTQTNAARILLGATGVASVAGLIATTGAPITGFLFSEPTVKGIKKVEESTPTPSFDVLGVDVGKFGKSAAITGTSLLIPGVGAAYGAEIGKSFAISPTETILGIKEQAVTEPEEFAGMLFGGSLAGGFGKAAAKRSYKTELKSYKKALLENKEIKRVSKTADIIKQGPTESTGVKYAGDFNSKEIALLDNFKIERNIKNNVRSIEISTSVSKIEIKVPEIKKVKVPEKSPLYKKVKNIYYNIVDVKIRYRNTVSFNFVLKDGTVLSYATTSFANKPITRFRSFENALKYGTNKKLQVTKRRPKTEIIETELFGMRGEKLTPESQFLARRKPIEVGDRIFEGVEIRKRGKVEKVSPGMELEKIFEVSPITGEATIKTGEKARGKVLFPETGIFEELLTKGTSVSKTKRVTLDLSIAQRIIKEKLKLIKERKIKIPKTQKEGLISIKEKVDTAAKKGERTVDVSTTQIQKLPPQTQVSIQQAVTEVRAVQEAVPIQKVVTRERQIVAPKEKIKFKERIKEKTKVGTKLEERQIGLSGIIQGLRLDTRQEQIAAQREKQKQEQRLITRQELKPAEFVPQLGITTELMMRPQPPKPPVPKSPKIILEEDKKRKATKKKVKKKIIKKKRGYEQLPTAFDLLTGTTGQKRKRITELTGFEMSRFLR